MKLKSLLDHFLIALSSFAVTGIIVPVMADSSFLSPVARALESFSIYEIFYDVMPEQPVHSEHVTIVDMSDVEDRAQLGDILLSIDSCQPAVMAVDLIFPGDEKPGSMELLDKVARIVDKPDATPVVFGYSLREYDDQQQAFTTSLESFFSEILPDECLGYTNIPDGSHGQKLESIVLDYPTTIARTDCRPLSFKAVQAINPDLTSRITGSDLRVDLRPVIFDHVSHDSIAQYAHLLRDRIVLVGPHNGYEDQKMTVVGQMPGVEYHAYAVHTILSCSELHYVGGWVTPIINFIMVFITSILYSLYKRFYKRPKYRYRLFGTSYMMSWVLFVWAGLITWTFFLMFEFWRLEFDITGMLVGVLFIVMTSDMYSFLITFLYERCHCTFFKDSEFLGQLVGNDAINEVKSTQLYKR